MRNKKTGLMVMTSLCIALGLLLPMVTAHGFGIPGNVLLPMHIPVLLCGLLCGPFYGGMCGLAVPVLSSILTNMPVFFPTMPVMAVQLLMLGAASGWLRQRKGMSATISVGIAAAAGWAAYGAVFYCLWFAGVPYSGKLAVGTAMLRGLPGMGIQLLLIPFLIRHLESFLNHETPGEMKETSGLAKAKEMIQKREATCVVLQDGDIVRVSEGLGISPLLRLFDEEPKVLYEAVVVDKIIGKAAAMILVLAGAKMVYGEVMSVAGRDYLHQHQVQTACGRCVEVIHNRSRTGICPIESAVLSTLDAAAGVEKIRWRISELKRDAG